MYTYYNIWQTYFYLVIVVCTHKDIELYFWINYPKSDCIQDFPIHLVTNQLENGKYNLISVSLTRIRSHFLCVYIHTSIFRQL